MFNLSRTYFEITLFLILFIVPVSQGVEFPVGARPGGMGDAFVAGAKDAVSIFHNPAGLGELNTISTEVFFGWEGFPLVENWAFFFARPSAKNSYIGMSSIKQKRDFAGVPYRSFQLILPTTYRISGSINTGMNFKYITQKKGSESFKDKFSLDFGFQQMMGMFSWGIMARNILDPKMRSFPVELLLGTVLYLGTFKIEGDILERDWRNFTAHKKGYRIGWEIDPVPTLTLRSGWEDYENEDTVSLGLGLHSELHFNGFDYCYRAQKDNFEAGTHWFSYTYFAP